MNSSSSKCLDISKELCTSRPAYNLTISKEASDRKSFEHPDSSLSLAEADLYAMGMATQDALYLKSLLQEMKLSQLAKPAELTVFTDSSSGKALASKLGLTTKSKHIQLRYLFRKDLLADGQLQLSKIPAGKNPAVMLTKHLSASNLHSFQSLE